MANPYKAQLDQLLTNPNSFNGTPGYNFALNQGLQGVQRGMSSNRGSGNALAALTKYGTGLAAQDYGNQVDRLGKLSGQADVYDLGLGQNANVATRNANDFSLGQVRNTNDATQNANQFALGQVQNANTATRNANDFSLGNDRNANDLFGTTANYDLGMGRNANDAQNNWWANEARNRQMDQTDAKNYNDWGMGWGELGVRQQQANTNLGDSRSRNWLANYKTRGFGQG